MEPIDLSAYEIRQQPFELLGATRELVDYLAAISAKHRGPEGDEARKQLRYIVELVAFRTITPVVLVKTT